MRGYAIVLHSEGCDPSTPYLWSKTMTPRAQAFLNDLRTLCQRHDIKLTLDPMYECITLTHLQPEESPIDDYFWYDELDEGSQP